MMDDKGIMRNTLLFIIVLLLFSFSFIYELDSEIFSYGTITGMVTKVSQSDDVLDRDGAIDDKQNKIENAMAKAPTKTPKMIAAYNLEVPAATSKDKVKVAAKVKEKLNTDKKYN